MNFKLVITALALTLTGCASHQFAAKISGKTESLTIQTYSAPETGFLVNSHLLLGKTEAVLIDAQFTRSAARKLATTIRASNRKLTTIFITHAHPDHYLGLEILAEQFPNTRIYAHPKVVEQIRLTAEAKRAYWKGIYKDDLTDTVVVPEVYDKNEIVLGGNIIHLIDFIGGESEVSTALYIPAIRTIASGDILYSDVHLWLAEENSNIDQWLSNINELRKLGEIDNILPGHGKPAGQLLFEGNEKYLGKFRQIIRTADSPEQAGAEIKTSYPNYQLPIIADMSSAVWFRREGHLKVTPSPTPSVIPAASPTPSASASPTALPTR